MHNTSNKTTIHYDKKMESTLLLCIYCAFSSAPVLFESYGWFLERTTGLCSAVCILRAGSQQEHGVQYLHVPLRRDPEEEVERLFTCRGQA